MKEINNLENEQPINEWLNANADNTDIIVELRDKSVSNDYYTKLRTERTFSDSSYKLIWSRGEIISKEDFMFEYERLFNNEVDWTTNDSKIFISVNTDRESTHFGKIVTSYSTTMPIGNVRYTIRSQGIKVQDFIAKYEHEIIKYLSNLDLEEVLEIRKKIEMQEAEIERIEAKRRYDFFARW